MPVGTPLHFSLYWFSIADSFTSISLPLYQATEREVQKKPCYLRDFDLTLNLHPQNASSICYSCKGELTLRKQYGEPQGDISSFAKLSLLYVANVKSNNWSSAVTTIVKTAKCDGNVIDAEASLETDKFKF